MKTSVAKVCLALLLACGTVAVVVSAGPRSQIGNPIQHGRLTIFPVFGASNGTDSKYITLDEAMGQGLVTVGELGSMAPRIMRAQTGVIRPTSAASVNELALVNRADRPLLLLAGEIVSGGKQDRVVARDRVVPPHSDPVPLGVFCVEPGRWTGLTMEFAAAKLIAHPDLRKQAMVENDQQKVWDEVASSNKKMMAIAPPSVAAGMAAGVGGGISGGLPMREVGTSYAKTANAGPIQQTIADSASAILPQIPDDAVGVIVAVDGRIVWADVFPSAALFRRYRAKLMQSYVVQSYNGGGVYRPVTLDDASTFLRDVGGHQNIDVEPGLYRLVRSEANGMITYELEDTAGMRLHFARMTR
jgi:hypothetical protein